MGDAGRQLHAARAARPGRLHLALEPAAVSPDLEARAGARRRQLRHRQALRADPGHGRPVRRALHRGRPAARRAEHPARAGPGIGQQIVEHPAIRAISFTGGTRTGALDRPGRRRQFKKLSLELGGKNPTIVFADCDFERTVDGVLRAAFTNQGQVCMCGSRILIERPLYERFRDALVERVRALRVGDPLEPGTDQGALISAAHRAEGARLPRAGPAGRRPGAVRRRGGAAARSAAATAGSSRRRCSRASRPAAAPTRKKSSARSPPCCPSTARTRPWRSPTTCPTARGLDLGPRHRPLPPGRGAGRGRRGLGQLLDAARPAHAARRHQAVRPGPRGRLRGDALFHRAEERLRELRMR
jgi:hypothetical protein